MDFAEARTLKDFLLLYNKISEDCFKKCVYNMTRRSLDGEEAQCISTCVQKHVNVNHKTMECFAEINPIFEQRKLEAHQQDLLKQQQMQEAAAATAQGQQKATAEESTNSQSVAKSQ